MSADQIFVLLLVSGVVLVLGWISWDSRRRERIEKERQANEPAPVVVEEVRPEEVSQNERRRRRRR